MTKRIIYFDLLKIIASLAVVMLHVAVTQYKMEGIHHYIACFYRGISMWGVPIFVMISGALFLDPAKTITISNIFKKYIFRIVIIFFIWALFYTCISHISKDTFSFYFVINPLVDGYYHQWFLYMIAALYLITPLLRPVIEKKDKNLLLYLLIIWFIMSSIVPFISFLIPQTKNIIDFLTQKKLYFSFPLSFIGYFVLGYYLHITQNTKKIFLIFFTLICCLLITTLGDMYYSTRKTESFFLDPFCPFVIITAVSIFLLVKNKYSQISNSNNNISRLSNLTLGVYMIHPFFIEIAKKINLFDSINFFNIDKFFITPIIFILVSFLSFYSVHVLSKIPVIKKYCL